MNKAEKISSIIRCPKCYGELYLSMPDVNCVNPLCGAKYVFENNCPVLMTPEDKAHLQMFLSKHSAQTVPAFNNKFRMRFLPPGPCYDPRRNERLKRFWSTFSEEAIIIDIGSQSAKLREDVINFDLAPFQNVNLVGNALRIPVVDNSVDGVINTGVLEHVEDVDQVIKEIHRILKPNGVFYIEIPFMQGYHPDPTDFQRLTYQGLERSLKNFKIEEMDVSSGPYSNICWAIRETIALTSNTDRGFTWLWIIAGWLTFWIKYFDRFVVGKRFAHRVASSYYVIATKQVKEEGVNS